MKIRLTSKNIHISWNILLYIYRFLEENYKFFELSKTQEFITRINQLPLSKDEKLRIINYKPENIAEISVVSENILIYFLLIYIAHSKNWRKVKQKSNWRNISIYKIK